MKDRNEGIDWDRTELLFPGAFAAHVKEGHDMKDRHEYTLEALNYIIKDGVNWYDNGDDELQWDTPYGTSYVIITSEDLPPGHAAGSYILVRLVGDETGGIADEHQFPTLFQTQSQAVMFALGEEAKEQGEALYWEDTMAATMAAEEAQTRDELPYETPEGWEL